jgi:hypothetical protein
MVRVNKSAAFLLLFFFVLFAMLPAGAKEGEVEEKKQAEPPGDWLKLNFTNTYVSRYMWRGTDLNNGNPMWEPVLEFVLGESGNTFTMAGYYGLQGSRYNDEVDYVWKYEYQLNLHFCLAFNIAYYDFLHQIENSYGEAYFTLTWADGPLKPAVSYYKELGPRGPTIIISPWSRT